MCLPVVRGRENRHGFASFAEKNSNSFLKVYEEVPWDIMLPCKITPPEVEVLADLLSQNRDKILKPKQANNPNIPGYTGKVHLSATHSANSNLPSTTPSIIARMHGYIAKDGSSSEYNHHHFSQRVTPVSRHNSSEEQTVTV
ncbi:LOW QUALITY PROTEIN: protein SPMIP7 [Amazona ochrocephala]